MGMPKVLCSYVHLIKHMIYMVESESLEIVKISKKFSTIVSNGEVTLLRNTVSQDYLLMSMDLGAQG